jgi:hypothetical protein
VPVTARLLDGTEKDSEAILVALRDEIFPGALRCLNEETLPVQFSLFRDDVVPTNQRNLTDVRTRMGVLLEYELGKCITSVLPRAVTERVALTYVIANKYPDLAFRTRQGGNGVRFEVKAIETIAEEKAANFDTLIKDIRKGTDFVVALVWGWQEHEMHPLRWPRVYNAFVFDAYQLALMRDCWWLNRPPDVGDGRQGFDLCFGVNCSAGSFNKEEGNYGKLMRIFDSSSEAYLPEEVRRGTTLAAYYEFQKETIRLGLEHIGARLAAAFLGGAGAGEITSVGLPVVVTAEKAGDNLLVVGSAGMPGVAVVRELMGQHHVSRALVLNEKFQWKALDD